jgi:hypothetical protein
VSTGGYYLRKSWKYFEEAEQLDRQARQETIAVHEQIRGLIDFGFGVFHFAISLVPRTVQWLVSLLGFEGQRPLSLTLLRRAADSQCLKRTRDTCQLLTWPNTSLYRHRSTCRSDCAAVVL